MNRADRDKKLKVAVVGPYPADPNRVRGGIQAVVNNLVAGLAKFADLDVHVVTVDFIGEEQLVPRSGVTVHLKTANQSVSQLLFYRSERRWLTDTIANIQPDIIHVHGTNFYGCDASNWEAPTIITVHGVLEEEAKLNFGELAKWQQLYRQIKGYFNQRFEQKTLSTAKYATVISPHINNFLADFAIDSDRIYPINNPTKESSFDNRDRTVPGRILFAGSITVRKGILTLLQAANLLQTKGVEFELHLAGGIEQQSYADILQNYMQEHQLESRVTFCGLLDNQQMKQAIEECQVLVLPSQAEVSPMIVQEAMAASKAVVATNVGGVPYLVEDGESGILVSFGDEVTLAEALSKLLGNPSLAKSMGDRGRILAEKNFRQSVICQQTRNLYYQIVD